MAHFAEIDDTGMVVRVLVVSDDQAPRGAEFLARDLGLGGRWVQCSYNGSVRKQYPGVGYTYDAIVDVFIAPRPFASWTLDAKHDWQPPIPSPGLRAIWDEATKAWK